MIPTSSIPRSGARRPQLADLLSLTLTALFCAWAIACSPRPSGEPDVGPTSVVIGNISSFDDVNELTIPGSQFNAAIIHQLFLRLVEEQPDFADGPPTFAPMLAERWEFNEDRTQLTFTLRPDVRWTDGTMVSADDVRFTWQAQTSPEVQWGYSFVKESISDVEVIDPRTVRFHFSRTYATQLLDAVEGVILPRKAWSQLPFSEWRSQPHWFADHLVTNGPFMLSEDRPDESLELVRNPAYHTPGEPGLDRVLFRYVREQSNLLSQLLNREIDFAQTVRPKDARRIEEADHLQLVSFPTRQYTFVSWNTLRPYFTEPEVRRALAHAIDRQAIVETLWFGFAEVASSPILSTVWAHDRTLKPLRYDPQLAARLLAEHGWVDRDGDGIREKDGLAFSFELSTNPGTPERWDAMQMIKTQLRAVGIDARPTRIEYGELSQRNLAHDYDATVTALAIDTSLDLTYAFHTSAIDNGFNFGSYSNPAVDRLIDDANDTVDQRQAEPLFHQLQQLLQRDQPFLFLWEPKQLVAFDEQLEGVQPNPLGVYYHLRQWGWRAPDAPDAEASGEPDAAATPSS